MGTLLAVILMFKVGVLVEVVLEIYRRVGAI